MLQEEKETIDIFDKLCRQETLGFSIMEKLMYKPVWECEGERFSEFECFFLIMIGDHPGITVNDLQRMWGRTQGAVSQRLITFEQRNLVAKRKCETDRRRTELLLTEKGKHICDVVKALKWQHAKDAVDVLVEHGYSYADIQKGMEMYQVLSEYGDECRRRVWEEE